MSYVDYFRVFQGMAGRTRKGNSGNRASGSGASRVEPKQAAPNAEMTAILQLLQQQ